MASPGYPSAFRLVLLKVSDSLTEENVKKLAFLCEDISPAKRDKLTTGVELFSELQGHDLLSERKVDVLTEWLDELGLSKASEQLKKYREELPHTDVDPREKCFLHKDLPLRYFCVSCDIKICPECAFKSHGRDESCDVIALDHVKQEIDKRRTSLMKEIDNASTATKSFEELWQQGKTLRSERRDASRKKALDDYVRMIENAEKEKLATLEKLDRNEIVDLKQQLERGKKIESLKFNLDDLKMKNESSVYSLRELQRINKASKEISEIKFDAEKQLQSAKTENAGIMSPRNQLVGVVIIGEGQLLAVYDGRRLVGGIKLECTRSQDVNDDDIWSRIVKVADSVSPVVMSCVDMWVYGDAHGLFAVGRTVFVVLPRTTSVTYVELDDLPAGSWITSITAQNLSGTPSDVFLISVQGSKTLKAYTTSGKPLDSIDICEDLLSNGISCLAYMFNTAAIIGHKCDDVIFISTKGKKEQCGRLRPPSSGVSPLVVLPVGHCLLVLYISSRADRRWEIVFFDTRGNKTREVTSGTFSEDFKIPIGIGRWRGARYIVFANEIRPRPINYLSSDTVNNRKK